MSEETNSRCFSYKDGHHLHYIAANRASKPRVKAEVKWITDYTYQVTIDGVTETWYHHHADRLKEEIENAISIEATLGRSWLFINQGKYTFGYNLSSQVLDPCIRENTPLDMDKVLALVQEFESKREDI